VNDRQNNDRKKKIKEMFNYISLRFKFRVVKSATISTQQSCSVCLYSHVDSFVGSSSFIYEMMISTKILGNIASLAPLLEATLSHGHCNGKPHVMEYHCRSDDFN
jgi:hypothetical protein